MQPSCITTQGPKMNDSDGLTAIAKCEATLEAIPHSPACVLLLREVLPVFAESDSAKICDLAGIQTKQSLLNDLPMSPQEFNQAWTDLCAFELEDQAWRPSSSMLWKIWKSTTSACALKGLSLDQSLDTQSLARTVEEDDIPPPVFHAVIRKLQVERDAVNAKVDRMKCIPWTGSVLLQSETADASPMTTSDFFRDWRDQLPEAWRKDATLEALQGMYSQPTKGTIVFDEAAITASPSASSISQPKASGPQARKWHERFKNNRR
ncbi:MAG: hypothetical protein Q9218_002412 [Villophora microphyllina]